MGHVARSARGHDLHDVEIGEGDDQREQHRDGDDVAHHRQRDVQEFLPGVGAVDGGGFIELLGHRFQRRQIHNEKERRPVPHVHQDHREPCPVRIAEPGDFAAAQALDQPVEGAVGGIEQPPPSQGRERERNDPRHQQHAAPFALALARQVVDEVRGEEPDQRFEEHGAEREDRRLLHHHPECLSA